MSLLSEVRKAHFTRPVPTHPLFCPLGHPALTLTRDGPCGRLTCSWPGCNADFSQKHKAIKHVRTEHFMDPPPTAANRPRRKVFLLEGDDGGPAAPGRKGKGSDILDTTNAMPEVAAPADTSDAPDVPPNINMLRALEVVKSNLKCTM